MRYKAPLCLLACLTVLLYASILMAQSIPVGSKNYSGTITSTNTFQAIQAQANNRIGCTVQNPVTNSNNQWVYFDSSNSANCSAATKAAAFTLYPGQSINCAVSAGVAVKDQVCITGTSGDTFSANFQ